MDLLLVAASAAFAALSFGFDCNDRLGNTNAAICTAGTASFAAIAAGGLGADYLGS